MTALTRASGGIAALLAGCCATGAMADDLCGRPFTSVEQIYREVTRAPGVERTVEDGRFTAFLDRRNSTVWTFARRPHPAAPAVVCRALATRAGGAVDLTMNVRCGGPRQDCDALFAEFQRLNERFRQQLRR